MKGECAMSLPIMQQSEQDVVPEGIIQQAIEYVNKSEQKADCTCGTIHMADHNAMCDYCSRTCAHY